MARIKKLELQGFKSFAKKTLITFPSDFSVICGPNGSGKSNILDAVCFVLGRTSAKSLRADKMLEMIYNGDKPAEIAKVSIYIDNSDKKIPIEDDSVCISRRVNRKGISIYKLSGRTVTREKIMEILQPVHIRPDGHNIILQGDVTDVIEMSPLERREIIDEISGIQEYDEKRNKAQRELLTVEERLKEANIRLTEREATLKKLESEKTAAEQYNMLTAELDKLRASLAKQKLNEANDAMTKLNKIISEKERSLVLFDKEIKNIDTKIEQSEKKIELIANRLFDRAEDVEIVKQVEQIRSQIAIKRDKISANRSEISRLDNFIDSLESMQRVESRAVQAILKLGKEGVYGTIASLLKVSPKYHVAIEVAAGHHLGDIVVANEDIAIECINYLKKNQIGRATFLPLNKLKKRADLQLPKHAGVIGAALNLLEFDKSYFNAFDFVFGHTVVVDSLGTAKEIGIGKARFVTLDGDLIERSGVLIGGFYRKPLTVSTDIKKYILGKAELQKEIKQTEAEIISLNAKLEQLSAKQHAGAEKLVGLQKEKIELEQAIVALKEKKEDFYKSKIMTQQEIGDLKIKVAKLEAQLEAIKTEFESYPAVELYQLAVSTLQAKIRECTARIQSLGPINQRALEEYKQLNVIYTELKSKVDKLAEERNKILELIFNIEARRKETFMNTLNAIAERFKSIFKDMMGGGETALYLEQDILDSGLIIEVSLPGKASLNIDSLSGGEKTLTALAFLFAIQHFRPAPFYILDEIDAALDKTNAKKIVELIKNYSKAAQFIVISHNDTTVAAANCVYGVSMEKGESKLVGIKMP